MVVPNDDQAAHNSSIELKQSNYTVDGMEEGDAADDVYSRANPARPGFTKSDQKDMWRMGKVQELKVSSSRFEYRVGCETRRCESAKSHTVLTCA